MTAEIPTSYEQTNGELAWHALVIPGQTTPIPKSPAELIGDAMYTKPREDGQLHQDPRLIQVAKALTQVTTTMTPDLPTIWNTLTDREHIALARMRLGEYQASFTGKANTIHHKRTVLDDAMTTDPFITTVNHALAEMAITRGEVFDPRTFIKKTRVLHTVLDIYDSALAAKQETLPLEESGNQTVVEIDPNPVQLDITTAHGTSSLTLSPFEKEALAYIAATTIKALDHGVRPQFSSPQVADATHGRITLRQMEDFYTILRKSGLVVGRGELSLSPDYLLETLQSPRPTHNVFTRAAHIQETAYRDLIDPAFVPLLQLVITSSENIDPEAFAQELGLSSKRIRELLNTCKKTGLISLSAGKGIYRVTAMQQDRIATAVKPMDPIFVGIRNNHTTSITDEHTNDNNPEAIPTPIVTTPPHETTGTTVYQASERTPTQHRHEIVDNEKPYVPDKRLLETIQEPLQRHVAVASDHQTLQNGPLTPLALYTYFHSIARQGNNGQLPWSDLQHIGLAQHIDHATLAGGLVAALYLQPDVHREAKRLGGKNARALRETARHTAHLLTQRKQEIITAHAQHNGSMKEYTFINICLDQLEHANDTLCPCPNCTPEQQQLSPVPTSGILFQAQST